MELDERISLIFGERKASHWMAGVLTADERREVLELEAGAYSNHSLSFYDDRADVFHLLSPEAYVIVLLMIMRAYVFAVRLENLTELSLLSVGSVIDWLGQPVRPELFSNRFICVWGKMSSNELCVVEDWLWYVLSHGYKDEEGIMMALDMVEYFRLRKNDTCTPSANLAELLLRQ